MSQTGLAGHAKRSGIFSSAMFPYKIVPKTALFYQLVRRYHQLERKVIHTVIVIELYKRVL